MWNGWPRPARSARFDSRQGPPGHPRPARGQVAVRRSRRRDRPGATCPRAFRSSSLGRARTARGEITAVKRGGVDGELRSATVLGSSVLATRRGLGGEIGGEAEFAADDVPDPGAPREHEQLSAIPTRPHSTRDRSSTGSIVRGIAGPRCAVTSGPRNCNSSRSRSSGAPSFREGRVPGRSAMVSRSAIGAVREVLTSARTRRSPQPASAKVASSSARSICAKRSSRTSATGGETPEWP